VIRVCQAKDVQTREKGSDSYSIPTNAHSIRNQKILADIKSHAKDDIL